MGRLAVEAGPVSPASLCSFSFRSFLETTVTSLILPSRPQSRGPNPSGRALVVYQDVAVALYVRVASVA